MPLRWKNCFAALSMLYMVFLCAYSASSGGVSPRVHTCAALCYNKCAPGALAASIL